MEEIFTGGNNGDKLADILASGIDESNRIEFETELQEVLTTNQGLSMQYCQITGMFTQLPEEELHKQLADAFGIERAATREEALVKFSESPQIRSLLLGLRKLNGIMDKAFDAMKEHPYADKHRTKPDTSNEILVSIAVERGIAFVEKMPEEARDMMKEMMMPFVEPFRLKE